MLVINNVLHIFIFLFLAHTEHTLEVIESRDATDNGNSSNCSDDEDIDLQTKLINHHPDKDTT